MYHFQRFRRLRGRDYDNETMCGVKSQAHLPGGHWCPNKHRYGLGVDYENPTSPFLKFLVFPELRHIKKDTG